jgi:hypothetical protein
VAIYSVSVWYFHNDAELELEKTEKTEDLTPLILPSHRNIQKTSRV